jgi:hypothetical protein
LTAVKPGQRDQNTTSMSAAAFCRRRAGSSQTKARHLYLSGYHHQFIEEFIGG